MVRRGKQVGRNVARELAFGGKRGGGTDESDAVRDTKHVGVNGHGILAERHGENHVCSFSADTGKRSERLERVGNLSVETSDKLSRHVSKVSSLGVRITNAVDEGQEVFGGC